MDVMNEDLARVLGMIVGGGHITPMGTEIIIKFPYKAWINKLGIEESPHKDAVEQLIPLITRSLGVRTVKPGIIPGKIPVFTLAIEEVAPAHLSWLGTLGLPTRGELRESATVATLITHMNEREKRQFLRGLADLVASVRVSHRRFPLGPRTVSFELKNWKLPFEICSLLMHPMGIPVDQILWEHPNMHAGKNRDYRWQNKGFKVRLLADDFAEGIGFGMVAKQRGLQDLLGEVEARHRPLCADPSRRWGFKALKIRHKDENSPDLPEECRGHFIHYSHICAVLGCPYAPLEWLRERIATYNPQGNPDVGIPKPI